MATTTLLNKMTQKLVADLLIVLSMILFISNAQAENTTYLSLEDEIYGFTNDMTITRSGHEFAYFYSSYRLKYLANAQYNLSIHERPSARWGNLLWITYQQETVFKIFLSPNQKDIKTIAEQAAQQVHARIYNRLHGSQFNLKSNSYDEGY